MHKTISLLLLFAFGLMNSLSAQVTLDDYAGQWEGELKQARAFNFRLRISPLEEENFSMLVGSSLGKFYQRGTMTGGRRINVEFSDQLRFTGERSADQQVISGFLHAGVILFHVQLARDAQGWYEGVWNLFHVDGLLSRKMYLAIEGVEGEAYEAYPFFDDLRFRGTWATNFRKEGDVLLFDDMMTGLQFRAALKPDMIQLGIQLVNTPVAMLDLKRSEGEWARGTAQPLDQSGNGLPKVLEDGWEVDEKAAARLDKAPLQSMVDSIEARTLTHVHSVLMARKGKLIYENYFYGYDRELPHDTRSASKSIFSAVTGIALADGLLGSVDDRLYDHLPQEYADTRDSLKGEIRLRDLLTMASGLDAVDFGNAKPSTASEDTYQSTRDWLRTVLEADMIHPPGTHANYGSANPFLLGVAVREVVPQRLDLYMDQKLMAPLGITDYVIQTDPKGQPYFGGGMFVRPRDLLRFGQLYANGGTWKGQRILREDWVQASLQNYMALENTRNKNGYGYLWWHDTYQVGEQEFAAVEARGAGGQYISLIPALDLVVVITSGNYRNGRFWQPEKIIEEYLLPAVVGE